MQWVRPLSKEEALEFRNSVHTIDRYPNLKDAFFQMPNVPKSELLTLLNEWSLDRGQHHQQ